MQPLYSITVQLHIASIARPRMSRVLKITVILSQSTPLVDGPTPQVNGSECARLVAVRSVQPSIFGALVNASGFTRFSIPFKVPI